jgi:hypothetical protein|tara:strand:+ start:1073 stop:1321 length:249 start_codon:yes stop_codon:yes gene_type:complete
MEYMLTMIMCAFIEGKTTCMPPHTFETKFEDGYSCMLEGYTRSYDKIVELGRDDVNKYNIYIKFGCNEDQSHKTSISSKFIR